MTKLTRNNEAPKNQLSQRPRFNVLTYVQEVNCSGPVAAGAVRVQASGGLVRRDNHALAQYRATGPSVSVP